MWSRIGLASATILVLIGLGEGVARLVPPPEIKQLTRRGNTGRWAESASAARELRDDESDPAALPRDLPIVRGLGELNVANARGIHNGVFFRTNRHRFRGPEYEPRHPGFRIVVAGDSFTMGAGVVEEKAYPRVLEGMLDREIPQRRVEVVNAGMSGLNAEAILARLERAIRLYDPQLLVYGYTLNDIEGPHYERVSGDLSGERIRRAQTSPSHLWRWLWPRLVEFRNLVLGSRSRYVATLEHNYLDNEKAWNRVSGALDRLAAVARREGVCAHLLLHPRIAHLNDRHPFHPLYDHVAEAARARGIEVTNPWSRFDGRSPNELRLGLYDAHPNAHGHALLAEALRDGLLELRDDCWGS